MPLALSRIGCSSVSVAAGRTLFDLFEDITVHGEAHLAVWSEPSNGEFFVECVLDLRYRIYGNAITNHWDAAFHGSHLGTLYSILESRLEAGPRMKRNRRKEPQQ